MKNLVMFFLFIHPKLSTKERVFPTIGGHSCNFIFDELLDSMLHDVLDSQQCVKKLNN